LDAIDEACLKRYGRQESNELYFGCFFPSRHNNGDANPSARWNRTKQVWYCDVCGKGGGYANLARLLRLPLVPTNGVVHSVDIPESLGLTVSQYAKGKLLPLDFAINTLLLKDTIRDSHPVVQTPYLNKNGYVMGYRYRHSLTDKKRRFKWRTGDSPRLYGLNWLDEDANYVILTEGESNTQTALYKDFNSLGLPGAGTWKDEWAAVFDKFQTVYLTNDKDPAANGLLATLAKSPIASRCMVLDLGRFKDLSEMYLDDPKKFKRLLYKAIGNAEPLLDDGILGGDPDEKPEPVQWLWKGWLPLGKYILLAGDPGSGKGYLTYDLIARVTKGRPMPDEEGSDVPDPARAAGAVILSAEDDWKDTILPRLKNAGADLSRIRHIDYVKDSGGKRPVVIPDDLPIIAKAVKQVNAAIVVFDTLETYFPDKVDTHRSKDVKKVLML
jgi:hypothetical protein